MEVLPCPNSVGLNGEVGNLLITRAKRKYIDILFSSVQFSCSVVSDSLQLRESQHARPPCPSPTPGVHSNSRPSSQWFHPAISSSVVPFSYPQSTPASESFPMSQLFAWGGQSIGVSASAFSKINENFELRSKICYLERIVAFRLGIKSISLYIFKFSCVNSRNIHYIYFVNCLLGIRRCSRKW